MAKFHGGYKPKGESDRTTFENWDQPLPGMPEMDRGDSREGIDKQIRKDNIKGTNIKPRQI